MTCIAKHVINFIEKMGFSAGQIKPTNNNSNSGGNQNMNFGNMHQGNSNNQGISGMSGIMGNNNKNMTPNMNLMGMQFPSGMINQNNDLGGL